MGRAQRPISIHAPRTGSDPATNNCQGVAHISIHAPRTGSDNNGDDEPCVHARFQSTLPARGATRSGCWISRAKEPFQSTLPARGATWRASAAKKPASYFNPRSPHGERRPSAAQSTRFTNFNPRSPHGERPHLRRSSGVRNGFQSTLPARGATKRCWKDCCSPANFNPRSPHGERHGRRRTSAAAKDFNPRSPHGERPPSLRPRRFMEQFQSTLPARGATGFSPGAAPPPNHFNPRSPHGERRLDFSGVHRAVISIHAPRTGSDIAALTAAVSSGEFQSTLPARGATQFGDGGDFALLISIHAPRTGSDGQACDERPRKHKFQSTLPARGATAHGCGESAGSDISIHAPRTGSDIPRR